MTCLLLMKSLLVLFSSLDIVGWNCWVVILDATKTLCPLNTIVFLSLFELKQFTLSLKINQERFM